jgi:hypothetical protein
MRPVNTLHLATPGQGLLDILRLLASNNINQVPVVEQGRLIGMVSREAIMSVLAVRQGLGLMGDAQGAPTAQPEPFHDQQSASQPPAEQLTNADRMERDQAKRKEPVL